MAGRMAWGVSAHISCGGVAANGQRYLRTVWGGTRHREALSVSVPHGIIRKFREEDQPVSILQDFLIASVRESESNLGCCVADPEEGAILIGAVPTKSAICAGAAVAPKAMIGLGTGDPGIDWEFRHGVKGGMRQLTSLECQPQENRSSLRILDLECKWHLSPAGSFKGSQSSKKVLWAKTAGERGIRKLPVRGMDSEVISIGCLHKASQAVRIRRA